VSQLITFIIHDYADVYIDVPHHHTSHDDNLVDERYCPQLSLYNLHYMDQGRKHLTIQGLHDSTSLIRDHLWFPFTVLFDGSRHRAMLLRDVKECADYSGSALARLTDLERRQSLEEALLLFRQQGFI
jgi:hypothetical protein